MRAPSVFNLAGLSMWPRVALLCAAFMGVFTVFSWGIDRIPVTDRDEARFAQASKQMAQSGDWIDIRFQDTPRYKKPVGIYWAQTIAGQALGQPGGDAIWVYRLPSVLAATLACFALYWAGLPLVGAWAAVVAGIMLASSFLMHVEARIAKTDAALLLCTILAMGALARAWMGQARGWEVPAMFWTALAAGFLIKGPLILAPVLGVCLWLWIIQREGAWVTSLRPVLGVLWFLALTGPWYVLIILQSEGAFIADSLGRDLAAKVASAQESHGAPPGSYLLTFALTAWPWSLLGPIAVITAFVQLRAHAIAFLIGWVLPFWVVLELVPTKLLHYPLPLYPAVFLLAAYALQSALPRWGLHVGAVMWVVGAVVLSAVVLVAPSYLGNGANTLAVAVAVSALLAGTLGVVALYKAKPTKALAGLTLSGVLMAIAALPLTLPQLDQMWISRKLAAASACHDGPIYLAGFAEPSAVFLLGTNTILTTPAAARVALQTEPNSIAWIATDTDMDTDKTGSTISGLNYSNGQRVTLQLISSAGTDPSLLPCVGPTL